MKSTAPTSPVASLQVSIENPFLFRVGNNDSGSLHFQGQGVISSAYCRKNFKRQLALSTKKLDKLARKQRPPLDESFLDHMDYGNLNPTPFISTTRSLLWAIWEAERQLTKVRRRGVEFIVIDAFAMAHNTQIADEAIRALRLRGNASENYCDARIKMFGCCAFKAREVIINYYIPEMSIITCPAWEKFRTLLPVWFFVDNSPSQTGSRTPIPIPPNNGLESAFDRWSAMIESRFQWLRRSMSLVEWALTSRREAASFAFALFSSMVPSASELSSGERRSVRRFIVGAKAIARTLLHRAIDPSKDTTTEESAALEALLSRLLLDKWPKIQHSINPVALLLVCLPASDRGHQNKSTAAEDLHKVKTNDLIYWFPCLSVFQADRCTTDNCDCQASHSLQKTPILRLRSVWNEPNLEKEQVFSATFGERCSSARTGVQWMSHSLVERLSSGSLA